MWGYEGKKDSEDGGMIGGLKVQCWQGLKGWLDKNTRSSDLERQKMVVKECKVCSYL